MRTVRRSIARAIAAGVLLAGCAAAGAGAPGAAPSSVPSLAPALATAAGCDPSSSNVPTFRGGAGRTTRMPGSIPVAAPVPAWTLEAGAPLHSSPAVVGGSVFQGSAAGAMWAVELRTGARRWRAELDGALTSPTVVDDLVIVGSTVGEITALDRSTGAVRWMSTLAGTILGAPAPVDDGVLVGTSSGDVARLDARDGRTRWTSKVGGQIARSIAVGSGIAVVPVEPGHLVALDAASGTELWGTVVARRGGVGTPAIDGGLVLTGTGLDSGEAGDLGVVALDLSNGALAWRWASPDGEVVYTPALVDGRAEAVSEGGFVQALALDSGRELWRTDVGGRIDANPAVAGGGFVGADDAGNLTALDDTTGKVRWSAPFDGTPYAVVVSCGFVLVPTSLGSLVAFGPP